MGPKLIYAVKNTAYFIPSKDIAMQIYKYVNIQRCCSISYNH